MKNLETGMRGVWHGNQMRKTVEIESGWTARKAGTSDREDLLNFPTQANNGLEWGTRATGRLITTC